MTTVSPCTQDTQEDYKIVIYITHKWVMWVDFRYHGIYTETKI